MMDLNKTQYFQEM